MSSSDVVSSLGEEEEVKSSDDLEDWDNWEGCRPERWAPLGANDSDKPSSPHLDSCCGGKKLVEEEENCAELKRRRGEEEELTSALSALTTHFAQVQLRVSQIVHAPPEERENLLRALETFTFRPIPSATLHSSSKINEEEEEDEKNEKNEENEEEDEDDENVEERRRRRRVGEEELRKRVRGEQVRQRELIIQLKNQLEELEFYAYETGDAGLPQSVLLERHKLVVDQLKERLNLNMDYLEKLRDDADLKIQVDQAISELVSPLKMKEQLVEQLKTQISDLERFIGYLHNESNGTEGAPCSCPCPKHNSPSHSAPKYEQEEELRDRTIEMMKKALTLIQMFAVFGCSPNNFQMNSLKKSSKGNHWGDLRARLELAINKVYKLGIERDRRREGESSEIEYLSDGEIGEISRYNDPLTSAVRKDLVLSLSLLLQHGLIHNGSGSRSLVPLLNCFPSRSSSLSSNFLSPWDLVLKYYEMKNGEKFNSTPARRLSQSFGLTLLPTCPDSPKQGLLGAIQSIVSSHKRYKRTGESHFKALVSAALNQKKLVPWLRLIVRCQGLTEQYYQPWSYVSKTGFEDAFRSLEKLSSINFDLPVDLAIRQFQNIKDAFQ